MKLYVVRHAEAVERGEGILEEDRWLTPAGRVSFRENAGVMAKRGIDPGLIVTSPLARAVQTADILAEVLGFEGELLVSRELAPGFDREGLSRLLAARGKVKRLAVVGHEPDLGELVTSLLGLEAPFALRKGMVVALRLDPADPGAPARFRWVIQKGKRSTRLDSLAPSPS